MDIKKYLDTTTDNKLESLSYKIFLVSLALILVGILLGSFIKYTILIGSFGGFLLIAGILIYIASQVFEIDSGQYSSSKAGTKEEVK